MSNIGQLVNATRHTLFSPETFWTVCKAPFFREVFVKSGFVNLAHKSGDRVLYQNIPSHLNGTVLNLANNGSVLLYGLSNFENGEWSPDARMAASGALFFTGNLIFLKNKFLGTLMKVGAGLAMTLSSKIGSQLPAWIFDKLGYGAVGRSLADNHILHPDVYQDEASRFNSVDDYVKLARGNFNFFAQSLLLLHYSNLFRRYGGFFTEVSGALNIFGAFSGGVQALTSGNIPNLMASVFNYGSSVFDMITARKKHDGIAQHPISFRDAAGVIKRNVFGSIAQIPQYCVKKPFFALGVAALFTGISQIPKILVSLTSDRTASSHHD